MKTYIVWVNEYNNNYDIDQGGGYFEEWSNKLSLKFSTNPIQAKKYKSIKSATNRLGLVIRPIHQNLEDLIRDNYKDVQFDRYEKISKLVNEINFEEFFDQLLNNLGRIDTICGSEVYINGGYNDMIKYISDLLNKNNKSFDYQKRTIMKRTGGSQRISNNEEFWELFEK